MEPQRSTSTSTPSERWGEGPTIVASMWRYRWLVLSVTIVVGAAGFLTSQAQPEEFEASTRMFLTDPDAAGVFDRTGRTDLDLYLPQQTERVGSSPVLVIAAEALDDGTSPAEIRDRIEVEGDPELMAITITASAGDAEAAAAIANAVAEAYQEDVRAGQTARVERATAELDLAEEAIEEQIAALGGGADGAVGQNTDGQLGILTQRLIELDTLQQQLRVDARLFGSGVEFVEIAEPPLEPAAPRPRLTAAASGLMGLALSTAVAYRLAGRRRRISSRDEPGLILDVPLLGVLPTYEVRQVGTLRDRTSLEPRTAEAYRFVYSSLEATLRRIEGSTVAVTSASSSTGKTETSLQLAAIAARRGRDVLLIDADLRMHGLTSFLLAERAPGLVDLANQSTTRPSSLVSRYPLEGDHHLPVLTSGKVAGDGSDQLSERWFGRAFEKLVDGRDLALVDSPPLLAVADTATIAGYTDAIVLIVREGSTVEELERVRQRLQFVGQRLVGYVYVSPSALDDTALDYGLVRAQAWKSLSAPKPTTANGDAGTTSVPTPRGNTPGRPGPAEEPEDAATTADAGETEDAAETRPIEDDQPIEDDRTIESAETVQPAARSRKGSR